MPLMITRKPVYRTGADMNIYVLSEEWSELVPKQNFLQRCIRRLRFGTGGNHARYVFYTGAVDFLAFQKEYEKLLKYAVRHGYKTVAVSCDDEIGFTLANQFSRQFSAKKDLQITLCISEDVGISGSSIAKLEHIFFEDEAATDSGLYREEPVDDFADYAGLPYMPVGTEQLSAPESVEAEDEDGAIWLEEDFAPAPVREESRPQVKAPLIQSSRPVPSRSKESRPKAEKAKNKDDFLDLQEFLKQNDAGFKDTLLKYIDRTGKKDSEIYRKANVDRRLFSKIMNIQSYNPSKPTAIAFAIALELNLEETKDLIGRAGYTLSQASTFDRIIEFFILENNYNIYEINEALFYFDQSLLGC